MYRLVVDEKGVPLGLTLVGANRHDVSQLGAVLDSNIVGGELSARS